MRLNEASIWAVKWHRGMLAVTCVKSGEKPREAIKNQNPRRPAEEEATLWRLRADFDARTGVRPWYRERDMISSAT